ncbi:MAG: M23 family metallopeptidase [Chloroflexia bacterium]|nr:M23 family metallopeptidase [Chloroflexia bacterium]
MPTRRSLLAALLAAPLAAGPARGWAQPAALAASYPIGFPGRVLGDGFIVRHGYATENTWYNPGWLHTGEDWYALEGDTAGAGVFAIAAGEVVFAGSDYPGRVVIVRHQPDLFSMYGHLAYDLAVESGQRVLRGAHLGTVLAITEGRAPSHLHFEVRTFLTIPEVNGDAPRYGVGCGFQCPPGPGYWPIGAPEHPSALGWRNPTHAIATFTAEGQSSPVEAAAVVAAGSSGDVEVWSAPVDRDGAETTGTLSLVPGERFILTDVETGDPAGNGASAESYRLWYRIALPTGVEGWVEAVRPSVEETGGDGRPSAIRFNFLPPTPTEGQ